MLAVLICLIQTHADSQPLEYIRITDNFRNVPLASFFDNLEKEYGVKVFYKKSWIETYSLNISFTNNPLIRALNAIFLNHELTYNVFQDNIIVVFPRRLDTRTSYEDPEQTPDYR
jgi:hypothetical protein